MSVEISFTTEQRKNLNRFPFTNGIFTGVNDDDDDDDDDYSDWIGFPKYKHFWDKWKGSSVHNVHKYRLWRQLNGL